MKAAKTNSVAVLTADVHFTPATLDLASRSFADALAEAEMRGVPLVVAGDLLDTKDIIRAQCANRIINILSHADSTKVYVMPGNHDMANEKGSEHALNFLRPYCQLVESPVYIEAIGSYMIPYQTDLGKLRELLKSIPAGSRLIMHQGVGTAYMGHYTQDKTSLAPEEFADFRVISGHYHTRQDIKCGRPRKGAVGLFSYIGNPYTLTFGEAADPAKGFQVLKSDGLLEFVPTKLRKHVIIGVDCNDLDRGRGLAHAEDLVWVKVRGPKSELDKLSKASIYDMVGLCSQLKLDKIPTDTSAAEAEAPKPKNLTEGEILDILIEGMSETEMRKAYLKALWREITQ